MNKPTTDVALKMRIDVKLTVYGLLSAVAFHVAYFRDPPKSRAEFEAWLRSRVLHYGTDHLEDWEDYCGSDDPDETRKLAAAFVKRAYGLQEPKIYE